MKLASLCLAVLLGSGQAFADGGDDLDAAIARGKYLARLGDCAACHTAAPKQPFAGGVPLQSPLGTIYSTNITPDDADGIGRYSREQFADALRKGRAADGHFLYPAMPYPSFSRLSDQDVGDLYTYFMHGVQALPGKPVPSGIPWPLNMRWPLALWSAAFTTQGPYQQVAGRSAEWNRGAYLVQGLGHCGSCHTPRGIALQEKALDQGSPQYLAGAAQDGWAAPDIGGAKPGSLQGWSEQDLVTFLKTGRNDHSAAFGAMSGAVLHSTQYFSDADLKAVAVYLRSLGDRTPPRNAGADQTTPRLAKGLPQGEGEALYLDNCAACHRSDGQGYRATFPRLVGNSAVLGDSPESLIHIILKGSSVPKTQGAPTGLSMPDFGWRLNDAQVAELATFLRSAWGYNEAAVKAEEVARVRALQ